MSSKAERNFQEELAIRPVAICVGGFVVPLDKICWWNKSDEGTLYIGLAHDENEPLKTLDLDGKIERCLLDAFRVLIP